jgi:hypothetical protein
MNVHRHERIEQIKKLSEYLRRALTLLGYLLWLAWPMLLLLPIFHGEGTLKIGENLSFTYHELTLMQRIACSAVFAVVVLLSQFSVRYARDLMAHFSEGEIFNRNALQTARKAIHFGIAMLAIDVLFDLTGAVYRVFSGGELHLFVLLNTLFNGFLFFGLMYVLLWAFEIGTDLNDESELTI